MPVDDKLIIAKFHKDWIEYLSQGQQNSLQQNLNLVEINLPDDLVINAHQHREVRVLSNASDDILFETDKKLRKLKKCHAYLNPKTLPSGEKQLAIAIYNTSGTPKHLAKGTTIGQIVHSSEHSSPEDERKDEVDKRVFPEYAPGKRIFRDKDGIQIMISPHLTVTQHNEVVDLLSKYKHLFTTKHEDLSPAKLPPVKIQLKPDAKLTNATPYKQSPTERKVLDELLDDLVKSGILQDAPDNTPQSSPCFVVKNRNNTFRLISDLRNLNAQIVTDATPVPSVNLILQSLNKASSYCKIDLKGAYYQLEVDESSRYLLAIKTQTRLLQYTRLPAGLAISTSLFTKRLQSVLHHLAFKNCVFYLDDIISFGDSHEADLESCEKVLSALDKAGLRVNSTKCEFFQKETSILGHFVSTAGIKPLKATVDAVLNFPRPKTLRNLRQFLGLSSYYRKFQKNYAQTANPLTEAIKVYNATGKLSWTDECELAFQKIKTNLISPPLLRHYNEDLENFLEVDASLIGMGAVLLKRDEETQELHPISYMSRKFPKHVLNYASAERELLALTYSLHHFRDFCIHKKTTVFTDCLPIVNLRNFKSATSRLNRLSMSIVDFPIKVIYKRGSTNLAADALSRNPLPELINEDLVDPINVLETLTLRDIDIKTEQELDENLRNLKLAITNPDMASQRYVRKSRHYTLVDGVLYYKAYNGSEERLLLAIPTSVVPDILETYHDSRVGAHFGSWKTERRIRLRHHWDSLTKDVRQYTRSCHECQLKRPSNQKPYGTLQVQLGSSVPYQHIQMDVLGPLTQSHGFKYLLIITDSNTRHATAMKLRKADSQSIVAKLNQVANIYGQPLQITTDSGTEFKNKLMRDYMTAFGIRHNLAPIYSHHNVGQSERFNHTLVKMLSHFVQDQPRDWALLVEQRRIRI